MNAKWVEILHRCNGKAMVLGIADNLKFYLFPSFQGLFYKYLRGKGERTFCQFYKRLFRCTDTAAKSAKGVGRANHDGEAYLARCSQGIVHVLNRMAHGGLQLNLIQLLDEQVTVLGVHDRFNRRSKNFYSIL